MRLYVVLVVAFALAPTLATATTKEPEDELAVTVVRIQGKGVYVEWAYATGAVTYEVWRGTSLQAMQHIATTPNLQFTDFHPPDADVWYQIVSQVPDQVPDELASPMRGKCLALRGATGISVTAAHCMPGLMP